MPGKTIKTKIIFFSCSLLLSVAICQVLFGAFFAKSYYTNLKKNQVESLFADLKKNYSDNQNVIRGITQYAENAYNINVQIYSGNSLIYWNGGLDFLPLTLNQFDAYSNEPKAIIVKAHEMPLLPSLFNMSEDNIMLLGKFDYNGDTRYVRLTMSVESIDASVNALVSVNTYISVLVLAAGIIGALIFAKKFSKPIQNIQNVAQNVALLNFEIKADENLGTAELRDLSGSINAMADKLSGLISDLQASNQKLQADVDHQMRLEKMRREFVANVSHELKTPLHLLLMYAENLKNNIENVDKDYYCDTIIDETIRLNDIVKSLLDLSALENGLAKMNRERFDFSDFTEYVVSKMSVLFEGFVVDVCIEKSVFVDGDGRYLEQALKNFIINAVSHTLSGGHISINLKRQYDKAVFTVFNEGGQITKDDIPQIWESFYKTDKARVRTNESHSGLGLYVVRTIVQAHGGDYGVRNIENGVEFWFSLTAIEGN